MRVVTYWLSFRVNLCLSSWDLFIFSVRNSPFFIPIFVLSVLRYFPFPCGIFLQCITQFFNFMLGLLHFCIRCSDVRRHDTVLRNKWRTRSPLAFVPHRLDISDVQFFASLRGFWGFASNWSFYCWQIPIILAGKCAFLLNKVSKESLKLTTQ